MAVTTSSSGPENMERNKFQKNKAFKAQFRKIEVCWESCKMLLNVLRCCESGELFSNVANVAKVAKVATVRKCQKISGNCDKKKRPDRTGNGILF